MSALTSAEIPSHHIGQEVTKKTDTDNDDSEGEGSGPSPVGPVPEWRKKLVIDCHCGTQSQRHKYRCPNCGTGQHIACYYGYRTRRAEFMDLEYDIFDPDFRHFCLKCRPSLRTWRNAEEARKYQAEYLKRCKLRTAAGLEAARMPVYSCVCDFDSGDEQSDPLLCSGCGKYQHASCFQPSGPAEQHRCHLCGGRPVHVEMAKTFQRGFRGIPEPVADTKGKMPAYVVDTRGLQRAKRSRDPSPSPCSDHGKRAKEEVSWGKRSRDPSTSSSSDRGRRAKEEVSGASQQPMSRESQPEWVAVTKSGRVLPNPFTYNHERDAVKLAPYEVAYFQTWHPAPKRKSQPIVQTGVKRKREAETVTASVPEETEWPRPKKVLRLYGTTAQRVGFERLRQWYFGKGREAGRVRRLIVGRSYGIMAPKYRNYRNHGDPMDIDLMDLNAPSDDGAYYTASPLGFSPSSGVPPVLEYGYWPQYGLDLTAQYAPDPAAQYAPGLAAQYAHDLAAYYALGLAAQCAPDLAAHCTLDSAASDPAVSDITASPPASSSAGASAPVSQRGRSDDSERPDPPASRRQRY